MAKEAWLSLGQLCLLFTGTEEKKENREAETILDFQRLEEANAHGRAEIRFFPKKEWSERDLYALLEQPVRVETKEGLCLFAGIPIRGTLEEEKGCLVVCLELTTFSIALDQIPQTRVFQQDNKTLEQVAKQCFGTDTWLVVDPDVPLPEVYFQKQETDWNFVKRLANQKGIQLLVNGRARGSQVHLGTRPFSPLPVTISTVEDCRRRRNPAKLRRFLAEGQKNLAVFELDEWEFVLADLSFGVGSEINWEGRPYLVIQSWIFVKQGILHHRFRCTSRVGMQLEPQTEAKKPALWLERQQEEAEKEQRKAGQEETRKQTGVGSSPLLLQERRRREVEEVSFSISSITLPNLPRTFSFGVLTGRVQQVAGSKIQVDFGNYQETPRWIPYASAISHTFYCMPEPGDTVFVSYESEQPDRMVCLGSRHPSTFVPLSPEDQEFRFAGNLIRFREPKLGEGDDASEWALQFATNDQEVGEAFSTEQSSLIFWGDGQIQIFCNAPLVLRAKSSLLLNAKSTTPSPPSSREASKAQHIRSFATYRANGGVDSSGNLTSLVYLSSGTWQNKGSLFSEPTSLSSAEQGCIQLLCSGMLSLTVGNNSLKCLGEVLLLKAPLVKQVGLTQSSTYEKLEVAFYPRIEMIKDGLQFGFSVAVLFVNPLIGLGISFANGMVSLVRGYYVAGTYDVVSVITELFPWGKGVKLANRAFRMVKRCIEIVDKVNAAVVMVYAFCQTAQLVSDLLQGDFDWQDPECRQDLEELLLIGASLVANFRRKWSTKQENSVDFVETKTTDHEIEATMTKPQDDSRSYNQNLDSYTQTGKIEDKKLIAEPVDPISGSFLYDQRDALVQDVREEVCIGRSYTSDPKEPSSFLGSGWSFSWFSSLLLGENQIYAILPEKHRILFQQNEAGEWIAKRGGRAFCLEEKTEGYCITQAKSGIRRTYDREGRFLTETDRNGNQKVAFYEAGNLVQLRFASGLSLRFVYENGLLVQMIDPKNRTISYTYEGSLLTKVQMANGGSERYQYDEKGYLCAIRDAEGTISVRNAYDAEGRVEKQWLSNGQEYQFLYEDALRKTTFLAPKSGKKIQYTYNEEKLLLSILYTDGTTEQWDYDDGGNRVYYKDRKGGETRWKYEERGLLLEEERPGGLHRFYAYNEQGVCIRAWDNAGSDRQDVVDTFGNVVQSRYRVFDTEWITTLVTYDAQGRVLRYTDGRGNTTEQTYATSFSRPSTLVTPMQDVFTSTYDAAGRKIRSTHAEGSTSYCYTYLDFLHQVTDPLGHSIRYGYNYNYDLVKIVLPNQSEDRLSNRVGEDRTYDAFHHQISTMNPVGAVFATPRDLEGNIRKVIHANSMPVWYCPSEEGIGISYEYDADDRLLLIHYPEGGVERNVYDANGNLIKKILPKEYEKAGEEGKGYTYEYDAENRLIQICTPEGGVSKRFVYDKKGRICKEIEASGYQAGKTDREQIGTLFCYDGLGRLLEKRTPVRQDEKGAVWYQLLQYAYDGAGNRILELRYQEEQREQGGYGKTHSIHYTYDKGNRLILVEDGTGAKLTYSYNFRNQVCKETRLIQTDVEQVILHQYDAAGRRIKTKRTADQAGCGKTYSVTQYEHDKNGNLTRIILPGGAEIRRTYDAADRLLTETHQEKESGIDHTTYFAYDLAGNLLSITDGQGRKTQLEYDWQNRLLRRIEADGSVTRTFYDVNGQVCKEIRPREYEQRGEHGAGTQYGYDTEGRLVTVLGADGAVQQRNEYDETGRLLETLDGAGSGVRYTYDLGNRPTKVETKGGAAQTFTYDAFGQITGITDGMQNRTEYELDAWGRIIGLQKADGSIERYTYDFAGNVTSSTDGGGHTTKYLYNAMNQLAKRIDPLGYEEQYFYNLQEKLCKKIDRNGTKVEYGYNLYGAPLYRKEEKTGLSERYFYTPEGLLSAAVADGMRYDYRYDACDRLLEKSASGKRLLSFVYDRNGNVSKQTDWTGAETEYRYNVLDFPVEVYDHGRKIAAYTYGAGNRVVELQNGALQTKYTYDAEQNLASLQTEAEGRVLVSNQYRYDHNGNCIEKKQQQGTTLYTYDCLQQLTQVQSPGRQEVLFYDPSGNRTKRILGEAEELYQYDARNRLTQYTKEGETKEFTYDLAGNLLQDEKQRYTYDGFGRTQKVETFSGAVQVHRYDAEGLRHEMEENGKLVQFLFCSREVVAEKTEETSKRYLRGSTLLACAADYAATYYHYASDERGSVTHLLEGNEVKNQYCYDAWGALLEKEEQVENRFQYAGEQYDGITGQYYLRARYYNPVLSRFTQEDPYLGDGLNLYAYCRNNPVKYVDPTGRACTAADQIAGDNQKYAIQSTQAIQTGEAKTASSTSKPPGIEINGNTIPIKTEGNGKGLKEGYGTLSNVDARRWYLEHEAMIPDLIDTILPIEQQARQAFELRNQYRTQARELMSDRALADSLNITDPNKTWEEMIQRQIDKGFEGEDIYKGIVESSQKSRKAVNKALGLEK